MKKEEICTRCGYSKLEHENQMLLAQDRIELRKFGAPCEGFRKEK